MLKDKCELARQSQSGPHLSSYLLDPFLGTFSCDHLSRRLFDSLQQNELQYLEQQSNTDKSQVHCLVLVCLYSKVRETVFQRRGDEGGRTESTYLSETVTWHDNLDW